MNWCGGIFRAESNRYSMVSTNETYPPNQPQQQFDASTYDSSYASGGQQRPRHDSNQLLMLPAPLGRGSGVSATLSPSTTIHSPPSEEGYVSDVGSQQRLVHTPSSAHQEQYGYQEDYENPLPPVPQQFDARISRTAGANSGVLRQSTVGQYQVETQNPYGYSQPQSAATGGYEHYQGYTAEPEELPSGSASPQPASSQRPHSRSRQSRGSRGISLADNGPVPAPDGGVRRVSRQGRRPTSQVPPQNRYSRSTPSPFGNGSLPPGAAPPQPGYGY